MANESEEGRSPEEEDEGGPIKSFLEHLEDLRWTLIKSSVAITLGVLICLLGGNYVVGILLRPLQKPTISYAGTNAWVRTLVQKWNRLQKPAVSYAGTNHVVTVSFGTNRFGPYVLDNEQQRQFDLGSNRFVALQLQPITLTNGASVLQVLTLRPDPDPNIADEARHANITIANFGPADAFMTAFHVALYAGIALASPFIFLFVMQFVFPALKLREKRYIYKGLFFGLGLFLTGVCFCYFILLPAALTASQIYSSWLGFNSTMWKAEEYIGFVCKFMLGMGLGFELPVVILVLVKLGVVSYRTLARLRPYMIILNLILGAVLTTPEVFTQVLMAVPLQILYEISVWIAWYWERKERKQKAAAGVVDID